MSNSQTQNSPTASPRDALSDCVVLNALTSPQEESRYDSKSRFEKNIILPKLTTHDATSLQCSNLSTATAVEDTVHYLSPASMSPISARTVNEGDIYGDFYKSPSFMRYLHAYGKGVPEASTVSSSISCFDPELQRTLAVVKPEAMEYEDVIVRAIVNAGFQILRKRYIHLTPEQVSEIYAQHYGTIKFPHMVVSMSTGPVLSLCLGAVNAIVKWRNMVGPGRVLRAQWFFPMSMRVRFGLHGDIPDAVHASENFPEANRENRYVNPESILEPITAEEEKVTDYLNMYVNPTLVKGLTDVVKLKPIDPILHLADWLLRNNPFQPTFPHNISVLPT